MYTSCPECGTVFRISTTDLRVAEGHVRCGRCSAIFNAVATLADEPPPTDRPAAPPAAPPSAEPEQVPELLPELTPVNEEFETTDGDSDTLEVDIPQDNWSSFFKDDASSRGRIDPVVRPAADPETPERDVGDDIGSATADQVGLYRALAAESSGPNLDDDADWQALLEEVQDDDAMQDEVYVIESDVPQDEPELAVLADAPADATPDKTPAAPPDEPPDALPDESFVEWHWDDDGSTGTHAPLPADFAAGLAADEADADAEVPGVGSGANHEMAGGTADVPAGDRPFAWTPPGAATTVEPGRRRFYVVSCLLLAAFLLIQLVHHRRDELATNPAFTAALQRVYGAIGIPIWPAWDLRAYEVRNYEAVADRSSRGALDILARIAVIGNDPVGLPLVRVTLTDRFGQPLGSRVFEPAEYLGRNPPPREPVRPGTLIPVEISLKDPGNDAQGFDVDICLMSQRDGITCRSEREPFAR